MQTPPINARALGKFAMEALQRGDARGARTAFEKIVTAGEADASIFLALAFACRNLQDAPAALDAIDNALALEPRNLRALLFKADQLDQMGDTRAASSFYLAAINAAPQTGVLPPDLRDGVARARAMCDRYAGQFEDSLRSQLAKRGLVDKPSTRRFQQSLDMLVGKKERYVQEPSAYFFPELPQIQFFERDDFQWLEKIEAHTAAIRTELVEILKIDAAFKPYVQANPDRPHNAQEGMLNNPAWSAFYLWKNGEVVPENAARCPSTMSALESIPLVNVKNRSPSVLFSLLRPGARIPPHTGLVNTRLIGHLPLIVPPGCHFRVGNDVRSWVEGKAWLFDDTIEHEAWNEGTAIRVILLFEVWRPELNVDERDWVSAMFEAIDAHSGKKPVWEI